MEELLRIENLYTQYNTDMAVVHAVNGVSLSVHKGEAVGLVGETGAGKTTMALSVLGILPEKTGEITHGEIYFNGRNVADMSKDEKRAIRGKHISMIFQDPMTSLNPIIKVGDQIMELLTLHFKLLVSHQRGKRNILFSFPVA